MNFNLDDTFHNLNFPSQSSNYTFEYSIYTYIYTEVSRTKIEAFKEGEISESVKISAHFIMKYFKTYKEHKEKSIKWKKYKSILQLLFLLIEN